MPARLRFLLLYFLSWTLFFEAARLLFLLLQGKALPAGTFAGTLWYGARMDLSMAAYLSLPIAVFLLLSFLVPILRRPLLYQAYTILLLVPVLLLIVCDVEVYKQWGFRLDATPLKYLSSPAEAWASIAHLPVVRYGLFFVLCCLAAGYGAARLLRRMAAPLQLPERWYLGLPLLLLATGALIIPLRGGLQQTPLNQSSVYFSPNNFANQAALNVPWNFLFGVISEKAETNPYPYFPAAEARNLANRFFAGEPFDVQPPPVPGDSLNVLLVIWESGTAKAIDTTIEGVEITPGFNRLKAEGWYFANAWASGDRTDKGLPAVLSGYPALPQSSIIRLPNKAARLPTLGKGFRQKGYEPAFYYGGETEFANIKSYLLGSGYTTLIDKSDFAAKDQNSKWGAHDGVVADRILHDLSAARKPFFTTWLTLSSHEPFETPTAPVLAGSDDTHLFLNSIHYTDSVLYHFVRACEQTNWWHNTILVVVADHGHPLPATGSRRDNFRIPILFLGGALPQKGIEQRVVSQLDIASTVASLAGLKLEFPFSHNLASRLPHSAFFCFNNGFGIVQDTSYVLFDNVGRTVLEQSPGATPQLLRTGQALQQYTYQDFLDK
ncbi:LTA synthase family protein [Flaviaesturariibacter aridisoli]|uniref:LTA synthase family protein n=1 Tax=Flaviaesturariibacter aridisoli TaxID=2545761 RepID=A0A4R4E9T7_9BACT|nr:LTA synthase family protein [Flaviaesturariibacter aridisoli]TCZ74575.1 LTA synthase family protein [Flaviaesturariibacter aridisoli]